MSNYEDYNTTSKHYDSTRYAYDIDIIISYMISLNRQNLRILDVGGTGNFLTAIKNKISKIKN